MVKMHRHDDRDRKEETQLRRGSLRRSNRFVVAVLALGALGMLGLAFAAVPIYAAFCRATGFGGQPRRAEIDANRIADRLVKVRFDSHNSSDLPWTFKPLQREIQVRPGETALAFYRVINHSDETVVAMATYNINPLKLGSYFVKLECFCFEEQTLGPREAVDMPVAFYLDPAMEEEPRLKRIDEVTLSYTFFRQDKALKKQALSSMKAEAGEKKS